MDESSGSLLIFFGTGLEVIGTIFLTGFSGTGSLILSLGTDSLVLFAAAGSLIFSGVTTGLVLSTETCFGLGLIFCEDLGLAAGLIFLPMLSIAPFLGFPSTCLGVTFEAATLGFSRWS